MSVNDAYARRVALLVEALPFVAQEREFALKGGTAINLFIRDLPRLSIDIDLTFLPITDRPTALVAINDGLRRLADALQAGLARTTVSPVLQPNLGVVTKVLIQRPGAQVKVEVTPVLRGCVFSPEERSVTRAVEERFGYARTQVVSFADLYAGKLVAALDRQHPRDLFDVRQLLANEGIDINLRSAFLAYLISHERAIADVLDGRSKDLSDVYRAEFVGMSPDHPITTSDLEETRDQLVMEVVSRMPEEHRTFLLSFKRGEPEWDLLGIPGVDKLPAVRWKLQNLSQLTTSKRVEVIKRLERVLTRTS